MKVSSPGTAKQYRGHASIFATRPAVAETSDKSADLAPFGHKSSLCRAFLQRCSMRIDAEKCRIRFIEPQSRKLAHSPTLTTPESFPRPYAISHYEHLSQRRQARPRMERVQRPKCTVPAPSATGEPSPCP